jgi:predicted kinase
VSRPTVVLMLGEPGSGKTRLGTEIAQGFRIPFLARDDVRRGLYFTAGAWDDDPGPVPPADEAVEAFLATVETLAGLGVSCVAEYVFRKHRPEDLARITTIADCAGVRTWCDDAPARRTRRDRADRLLQRRAERDDFGYLTIDDYVADAEERMAAVTAQMETEFDFPVLSVNTSGGVYDPGVFEIAEFVVRPSG